MYPKAPLAFQTGSIRYDAEVEIRHFAEQLLFGRTLADKLVRPERLTDEKAGSAVGDVDAPGRPPELAIDFGKSKHAFPGLHELEHKEAHAKALHFFANHELLAIELMALVLLRFPDAPTEFRRGLTKIIQEEQLHFELYCKRAKELGSEIGEHPLNGFFWSALRGISSPSEAMAALSLTLEQANLDYASFYAQVFRRLGAKKTAAVLDRVLKDEIGHVRHGLHWFKQWELISDNELFERHAQRLQLHMSMRRAKGVGFATEARQQAGLPTSYIERLKQESEKQSKGRPPSLYLFNPNCEEELLSTPDQIPHAKIRELQEDFKTLPQFFAKSDDLVWVSKPPSEEFLDSLRHAGISSPNFICDFPSDEQLPHLSELHPWGWSPTSQKKLAPFFDRLVLRPRFWEQTWSEKLSRIHAKSFAIPILSELLREQEKQNSNWLCRSQEIGIACTSVDELSEQLKELNKQGYDQAVIKADYGSSGRNMIRVHEAKLETKQRAWLERCLQTHHKVVVEPWLDRVCDLSLQMHIDSPSQHRVTHIGQFLTDARGQYLGGYTSPLSRSLPPVLQRFINDQGKHPQRVQKLMRHAASKVAQALEISGYIGPVGIDAFIYQDHRSADADYRLKPIVEINPRFTMGQVCAALGEHVVHGQNAFWRIINRSQIKKLGFDSFQSFADEMKTRHPLRTKARNGWLKINSGVLFTTDPARTKSFVSLLAVGDSLDYGLRPESSQFDFPQQTA